MACTFNFLSVNIEDLVTKERVKHTSFWFVTL